MIRSANLSTDGLAPWLGAQRAMTIACEWWRIIWDMKSISAWVYGRRALSDLALAIPAASSWTADCGSGTEGAGWLCELLQPASMAAMANGRERERSVIIP